MIVKMLKESLQYIEEVDDAGSIDSELARLQIFFTELEPILDKNGGI